MNAHEVHASTVNAINQQKNITYNLYGETKLPKLSDEAIEASLPGDTLLAQANERLKAAYRQDIAMPYLLQKKATQTLYNCYLPVNQRAKMTRF